MTETQTIKDSTRRRTRGHVPRDVAFHALDNYPDKIMVWLCISDCGMSQPYFMPWNDSIRGEDYHENCVKEHLVPFSDEFHADGDYYFWPDLATSHYAKNTLAIFKEHNIAYIPCPANPPNCPQLCPIEDFRGFLKSKLYEGGWEARTECQLKQRIAKIVHSLDMSFCQTFFHLSRETSEKLQMMASYLWITNCFFSGDLGTCTSKLWSCMMNRIRVMEKPFSLNNMFPPVTQTIDGHAIGISEPLRNSCAVSVFVSSYLWQEEREEGQ